jgi:hypothetical protein
LDGVAHDRLSQGVTDVKRILTSFLLKLTADS